MIVLKHSEPKLQRLAFVLTLPQKAIHCLRVFLLVMIDKVLEPGDINPRALGSITLIGNKAQVSHKVIDNVDSQGIADEGSLHAGATELDQ